MLFRNSSQQFRRLLGFFFQLAIHTDLIRWLQVPGVAFRLLKIHSTLGFGQHRIVCLCTNLGCNCRSIRQIKTG